MSEFDNIPDEPEAAPEPVEATEAPEALSDATAFEQPTPQYQAPPPQYQAPPPPPQYQAPPPPPQYQAPPPQYQAPPPQYQAPPPQYQAPPYQQGYGQAPPPHYSYQPGTIYPRTGEDTLLMVAFIFMIIGTVGLAIPTFGIALAWGIPMTIHSHKIWKGMKPNTVAFGVCSLIFVGLIAGILLLVAPKDDPR